MDKLELSLQLFKESLANNPPQHEDIAVRTQKILESFETIYKKVSELESQSSAQSTSDTEKKLVELLESDSFKNMTPAEQAEKLKEIIPGYVMQPPWPWGPPQGGWPWGLPPQQAWLWAAYRPQV